MFRPGNGQLDTTGWQVLVALSQVDPSAQVIACLSLP